ncbi:hypothetical protein ES703_53034 [subsurface metagenome]
MRELGQIIKEKVVRLFLAGHSYEDIAQQLDIAKGSVTNIIDEFRDGQILIPGDMADYVNELRRITVDSRKYQVSLNQLRSYQKLHNKLHDMGADSEKVEQWLDFLQIVAASDSARGKYDEYIDIVGWIVDVSAKTGKNCKEILDDYEEKLGFWEYVNDEIDAKKAELEKLKSECTKESERINKQIATLKQTLSQTEEMYSKRKKEAEARLEEYLTRNKLSWEKAETVIAAMTEELIDGADVPAQELDNFYEKLRQAGSLFNTVRQLEGHVDNLRIISGIYEKEIWSN